MDTKWDQKVRKDLLLCLRFLISTNFYASRLAHIWNAWLLSFKDSRFIILGHKWSLELLDVHLSYSNHTSATLRVSLWGLQVWARWLSRISWRFYKVWYKIPCIRISVCRVIFLRNLLSESEKIFFSGVVFDLLEHLKD